MPLFTSIPIMIHGQEYFGKAYNHGTPFKHAADEGLIDTSKSIQVGMRGGLYTNADTNVSQLFQKRFKFAESGNGFRIEFPAQGLFQNLNYLLYLSDQHWCGGLVLMSNFQPV